MVIGMIICFKGEGKGGGGGGWKRWGSGSFNSLIALDSQVCRLNNRLVMNLERL